MSAVAPRWDIPSAEALQALVADPLPLGLRAGPARRSFLRDLYFDTPAGDLRRRDVACRVCFAADELLAALETEALARAVQGQREVAIVAVADGRMAFRRKGGGLQLLVVEGGGEEACRRALRQLLGTAEGQVRLLGTVPATERRPVLEVWVARRLRRDLTTASRPLQWFTPRDIVGRVGSPVLREPQTLAALAVSAS